MADPARALALWLAGVMALAVLAMQVTPVLAPAMAASSGLPPSFVGAWSGGLWACALVGTVLAPALLARVDAWRLAQICLLACALGALAAATGHWAGLVVAAMLIGVAQGLEGPMASHLLAWHVAVPRRPLWFSVKQSGVQVGAIVASLALPGLAALLGWRAAAMAAAGMALAGAFALGWARRRLAAPTAPAGSGRWQSTIKALASRPALRWLALAAAAFGAIQVVLNGFFVVYAVTERGASLVQAGAWLGVAQTGGLLGRLGWGWLATRWGATMPFLFALGLIMAACSLSLGLGSPGWILLILFGLSASGWNGIFLAEVARLVPAHEAGSATAAVLLVMTIGLVAGPLVFSGLAAAGSFSSAFVAWGGVGLLGVAALLRAQRLTRS